MPVKYTGPPLKVASNLPPSGAGKYTPDYSEVLESKPAISMEVWGTDTAKVASSPIPTSKVEHPGFLMKKGGGVSVTVSGSRTFNLGNYESARYEVGITVPCDPEAFETAYEWAKDFVSDKMTEAEKSVKGTA